MLPPVLLLTVLGHLGNPERFHISNALALAVFYLLFLASPQILFFFNYLSTDKDRYMQISRGHDEFVFGMLDDKKSYHKKDIAEISTYGMSHTKSLWRECELFNITFNNGEEIQFTSLLIGRVDFLRKFPGHQITDYKKFWPMV